MISMASRDMLFFVDVPRMPLTPSYGRRPQRRLASLYAITYNIIIVNTLY
jgi:hypothetical protein